MIKYKLIFPKFWWVLLPICQQSAKRIEMDKGGKVVHSQKHYATCVLYVNSTLCNSASEPQNVWSKRSNQRMPESLPRLRTQQQRAEGKVPPTQGTDCWLPVYSLQTGRQNSHLFSAHISFRGGSDKTWLFYSFKYSEKKMLLLLLQEKLGILSWPSENEPCCLL